MAIEPSWDFLEAAYRGVKNWFTERKQIADDRKEIAQIRQDNPNLAKKADQGFVGQAKRLREMQLEFIEGRVAEIDGLVPSGTSSAQLEKRKAEYEQVRALHDVQRGVNERDQESINQAVAVGSMFWPLPGGKGRMLGNAATKTVGRELAISPWPANRGFIEGTVERKFLMPGETFDRYGFGGGKFASPTGTPLEMRSLRSGVESLPYNNYQVVKPLEVNSGGIAPAFNQPGLGTQYELPVSINILLKRGIIKKMP